MVEPCFCVEPDDFFAQVGFNPVEVFVRLRQLLCCVAEDVLHFDVGTGAAHVDGERRAILAA